MRQTDRFAIRLASFVLLLRLIAKSTSKWISWALWLYVCNLPLATEVARLWYFVACVFIWYLVLGEFSGSREQKKASPASRTTLQTAQKTRGIAIPGALWVLLAVVLHGEGSYIGKLRLLQWISGFASSTTGFILFYGSMAFCYLIPGAYFAASRIWRKVKRDLWGIATLSRIFFREMFFHSGALLRPHREFIGHVAATCLVQFIEQFVYHIIICGLCKLAWDAENIPWFSWKIYFWQAFWIICRNVSSELPDHRRYLRMDQRERQPETLEPTAPAYIYDPFNKNEDIPLDENRNIRLLLLYPRHPKAPIKCSLFETLLDQAPYFEAMSYNWGKDEKNYNVIVDGKSIPVTENAYNLLGEMSSYLLPRLLWIDSICIDQENVLEKNNQVRLMEDIYRRASLVTVWLCTKTNTESGYDSMKRSMDAVLAFSLVKELGSLQLQPGDEFTVYKSFASQWRGPRGPLLTKLVKHEWFERIWVIQEVVLASSARVVYAGVEIDWEVLIDGLMQLLGHPRGAALLEWTDDPEVRSQFAAFTTAGLSSMHAWRMKKQQLESIPFVEVLVASRPFQARDPRDKVFAIQGLCDKDKHGWTRPDYSCQLRDVYFNATLRLIDEEGILRALSVAGLGFFEEVNSQLKDCPSWVTDCARPYFAAPQGYVDPSIDYRAGGKPSPDAHKRTGDALNLRGRILDAIDALAPPCIVSTNKAREWNASQLVEIGLALKDSLELIDEIRNTGSHYAQLYQDLDDVFWRLLIGNRSATERPAPESLGDNFDCYIEALSAFPAILAEKNNREATDAELKTARLGQQYAALVMRAWGGRRVCLTRAGLICLVPPYTRPRDVVCVFQGAQTPFVLRQVKKTLSSHSGTRYQLVGECYVHGIMDGEAMRTGETLESIEVI